MSTKLARNKNEIIFSLQVVEEVEWKLRAEVELQEKSEWRARDIQALRDLVLAEEGFVCDTSDAFLIKFLRAKKFDYESSFRNTTNYQSIYLSIYISIYLSIYISIQ